MIRGRGCCFWCCSCGWQAQWVIVIDSRFGARRMGCGASVGHGLRHGREQLTNWKQRASCYSLIRGKAHNNNDKKRWDICCRWRLLVSKL